MAEFLECIVLEKKRILEEKKVFYSSLIKQMKPRNPTDDGLFKKNISRPGKINLIAEIKKASPSKGILRENFNVIEIAKIYSFHAAAISVLTEEKFFLGNQSYVKSISSQVQLPLLSKDFFIDERQIFEAKINGAQAVLLIAALLPNKTLLHFLKTAESIGLDCLVEVHSEDELKRALDCNVEIIGINNRNLRTFDVDIRICERLVKQIPKGKIVVAESGIQTHKDILMLQEFGIHAVLIGEAFMRAKNIDHKIKELMYG